MFLNHPLGLRDLPGRSPQVAILVDDMIDTGRTLELAARTLKDKGAKTIHALISHGECLSSMRTAPLSTR